VGSELRFELDHRVRDVFKRARLVGVSDFYTQQFFETAAADVLAIEDAIEAFEKKANRAIDEANQEKDADVKEVEDALEKANSTAEAAKQEAEDTKRLLEAANERNNELESGAAGFADDSLATRIRELEAELAEARKASPAPRRIVIRRVRAVDPTPLFPFIARLSGPTMPNATNSSSDACSPAPVALSRAPRGSRKAAAASNTDRVLAAVVEAPRTVGEIAKACGLTTLECAAVLKPAREAGRVRGEGEKRGMRYSVGA
jgi:predicted phage tail protein